MTVYEIRELVKRYPGQPRPAIDHVGFDVVAGEIFGILGANGAGKSTLVRQMVNLLRRTSGTIRFFGQPMEDHPLEVPLNVGFMPQESSALNHLTAGEALYFTAHLRGLERQEARRERDALLALWSLEPLRHQDSARLSGGERRLLRLAAAMAGSPPVLILDEPTNDLDPLRRRLVWTVLRRINRERGTTIVFITHDALEAEKVVHRVAILHEGRLAGIGRPADLKQALGRELRIELWFPPDRPPGQLAGLEGERDRADHWIGLLSWPEAVRLLASLDPQELDDIRLQSPNLEDLYLHYAAPP